MEGNRITYHLVQSLNKIYLQFCFTIYFKINKTCKNNQLEGYLCEEDYTLRWHLMISLPSLLCYL